MLSKPPCLAADEAVALGGVEGLDLTWDRAVLPRSRWVPPAESEELAVWVFPVIRVLNCSTTSTTVLDVSTPRVWGLLPDKYVFSGHYGCSG